MKRWRGDDDSDSNVGDASKTRRLSLVSIDMGVRNLAYAHFTASLMPGTPERSSELDGTMTTQFLNGMQLNAWSRFNVTAPAFTTTSTKDDSNLSPKLTDHNFHPSTYANHAVSLIQHLLTSYKPTHILIERQRFRSGSGAAVQEWSLRVGVLEGMLWAALRAFGSTHPTHTITGDKAAAAAAEHEVTVQAVLPMSVNRYWFDQRDANIDLLSSTVTAGTQTGTFSASDEKTTTAKLTGRALKQAKIDLVGSMLESTIQADPPAQLSLLQPSQITGPASSTAAAFQHTWLGKTRPSSTTVKAKKKEEDGGKGGEGGTTRKLDKLDDLSDSMLQGLAWLGWQENLATLERKISSETR